MWGHIFIYQTFDFIKNEGHKPLNIWINSQNINDMSFIIQPIENLITFDRGFSPKLHFFNKKSRLFRLWKSYSLILIQVCIQILSNNLIWKFILIILNKNTQILWIILLFYELDILNNFNIRFGLFHEK